MLTAPATSLGWVGLIVLHAMAAVGTRHLVGCAWAWYVWRRDHRRFRMLTYVGTKPLHPSSPRFDPSPRRRAT